MDGQWIDPGMCAQCGMDSWKEKWCTQLKASERSFEHTTKY
jgi:hypothetical protein